MHWILRKEIANEETDAILEGELFGTQVSLPFEIGQPYTPDPKTSSPPKVNRFRIRKKGDPVPSALALRFVTDDDSQPGIMTDHLLIYEIPGLILSERFRKFLTQHGVTNIQYFDLSIEESQSNQTHDTYKVANLLDVVNCIDAEQSELIMDGEEIDEIDKLILDESRIPADKKLFRVEEYRDMILVSDELKRAIEAEGLSGCVFMPPEDFLL